MTEREQGKNPYWRICFGICQLVIGTGMLICFPEIMEYILRKSMVVRESYPFVKNWKIPEVSVVAQFYMFNLTNPADVPKGLPPNLKELGPYKVRVKLQMQITNWNKEDETFSLKRKLQFSLDEELFSGASENITLINLPVTGLLTYLQEHFSFVLPLASSTVNKLFREFNETLTQSYNIKSFLVDGIKIGLLDNLVSLLSFFPALNVMLKDNRIGILNLMNSLAEESITLHTGAKKPYLVGEVASYLGKTEMTTWRSSYCNMINGSEGGSYRRPVVEDHLHFFVGVLCRSFKLDYVGDEHLNGIPTRKYVFKSVFTNGLYLRENRCFSCRNRRCDKNGTLSLGPCLFGLPIYISQPHFYGGDPVLHKMVTGLESDSEKHETRFFIHEVLGVPLNVQFAIQINLKITPNRLFPILGNISEMIMPIVWVHVSSGISEFGTENLVWALLVAMPFAARCMGGILTIFGAIKLYYVTEHMVERKEQRTFCTVKVMPINIDEH